MPSKRKFYETTFTVRVLSEEDVQGWELRDVLRECEDGDLVLASIAAEPLEANGHVMAKLLIMAGSEEAFFRLTEDGDDMDEDA